MITRRAKAYSTAVSSSLAENSSVHAKLIYKYQIIYLDPIMIVPWRQFETVSYTHLTLPTNREV